MTAARSQCCDYGSKIDYSELEMKEKHDEQDVPKQLCPICFAVVEEMYILLSFFDTIALERLQGCP